jgi:group I intron endonuclease
MASGIYMIVNKINGKRYVGSSANIYSRWRGHLYELSKGMHHSTHFQFAYYKYGKNSFEFIIMEEIFDKNNLVPKEQTWLDFYKSYLPENGYNICSIAGSCLGVVPSKETKKKISLALKGRKHTKEARQRMSLAAKGKHPSKETKVKLSLSHKGKVPSEETKRKMRESHKKTGDALRGKPLTEETKRKMSIAAKAKIVSKETRVKMRNAIKNKWANPEFRIKMMDSKNKNRGTLV